MHLYFRDLILGGKKINGEFLTPNLATDFLSDKLRYENKY
jgi:hypothetical protein